MNTGNCPKTEVLTGVNVVLIDSDCQVMRKIATETTMALPSRFLIQETLWRSMAKESSNIGTLYY